MNARIIAPSKRCTPADLLQARETLIRWGFSPRWREDITEDYLGYAGTADRRAHEFTQAMRDPHADAVFTLKGGMGAIHLLDKIPWVTLDKRKPLIGYSDITILLTTLHAHGAKAIHGPTLSGAHDSYHPLTRDTLRHVLANGSYTVTYPTTDIFSPGYAQGTIIGGNLNLLERALGTPYDVRIEDSILFLEDVDLGSQWIHDMLHQLRLAGKFSTARGIILGTFTNCGEDISAHLATFFEPMRIPILLNQPIGHEQPNVSIPLGAHCIIDTEKRTWSIIQPNSSGSHLLIDAHIQRST